MSHSKRLRTVLNRARDLARTGEHTDHTSIKAALGRMKDFPEARLWLEDRRFGSQLDSLCARAMDLKQKAPMPKRRTRP